MATDLKRLTFVVTPEIEQRLDEVKRELYAKNQSEILRYLIGLGLAEWRKQQKEGVNHANH